MVRISELKEAMEKVRLLQSNPGLNPKDLISAQSKVNHITPLKIRDSFAAHSLIRLAELTCNVLCLRYALRLQF